MYFENNKKDTIGLLATSISEVILFQLMILLIGNNNYVGFIFVIPLGIIEGMSVWHDHTFLEI